MEHAQELFSQKEYSPYLCAYCEAGVMRCDGEKWICNKCGEIDGSDKE